MRAHDVPFAAAPFCCPARAQDYTLSDGLRRDRVRPAPPQQDVLHARRMESSPAPGTAAPPDGGALPPGPSISASREHPYCLICSVWGWALLHAATVVG